MASRLEYLIAFEETLPLIAKDHNTSVNCRTDVPHSLYQESLHDVWAEYNDAIINNMLGLQRHVFVLRAWDQVLKRFNGDDEHFGVVIDFVEPVLFRAKDLPGAIREQYHQCAGKMTYLLVSRDDTLDYVRNTRCTSTWWRDYHIKNHLACREYNTFRNRLAPLRNSDNAVRLQNSHGQRHHDIATIVGVKRCVPMAWKEAGGIGYGYVSDEVRLEEEIIILDEQRCRAQEAYTALNDYLDRVFDAHIDDLQKRGYDVTRVYD